jgi:aminoglycoside phosphotransferase (APT) family kinase protein
MAGSAFPRSARFPFVCAGATDTEVADWYARRRRLFYPKTDLAVPDTALRSLREQSPELLGLTPERIAAVCRNVFSTSPSAVEPLERQGTFHRLFRVRGVAGGTCVFRANAASDLCRDLLFHLDPWLAARLRAAGLPVLDIYAVDTSRSALPLEYEILAEARSPSLDRFHDDEPRMQRLLRRFGEFAAQIHALRLSCFGLIDVRPLLSAGAETGSPVGGLHPSWWAYLELNLAAHVTACVRIGAITAREGDDILALFAANADRLATLEPRLLHGDLGSHNVLSDGTAIVGLIDWEDCLAGDPVFDIAGWATFQPEHRHPAFLEGYRAAGRLPDDFDVRFWLYYLRIALAKTVHRFRFGYADRPDRPAPSLRIRRGLEGVRRAA